VDETVAFLEVLRLPMQRAEIRALDVPVRMLPSIRTSAVRQSGMDEPRSYDYKKLKESPVEFDVCDADCEWVVRI
jgi:hypothetical protein